MVAGKVEGEVEEEGVMVVGEGKEEEDDAAQETCTHTPL